MGRPLAGSIRRREGRWLVSVPEVKGSQRRREESFVVEDDARAWMAQAVIALNAGLPVPDPHRFRAGTPVPGPQAAEPVERAEPSKISADIASVAAACDLRRGGTDRADHPFVHRFGRIGLYGVDLLDETTDLSWSNAAETHPVDRPDRSLKVATRVRIPFVPQPTFT